MPDAHDSMQTMPVYRSYFHYSTPEDTVSRSYSWRQAGQALLVVSVSRVLLTVHASSVCLSLSVTARKLLGSLTLES